MPASPSRTRDLRHARALAHITDVRVRTSLPSRARVAWDRYAQTLFAALAKLERVQGSADVGLADFGEQRLDVRPAATLTRVWWSAIRFALRGDRSAVVRRLARRLTRTVVAMQRVLDDRARAQRASRTLPLCFDRPGVDRAAGEA